MATRVKKITIDTDIFYAYIGELEDNQRDFIKEHLDLKTMKIAEDKFQEFYNMLCSDGQETMRDEFSNIYTFKRKGPVIFDNTDTRGWNGVAGEYDDEDLITITLNDDDETLGTITYDHELIKVNIVPDGKGVFVITADYL